MSSAVSPLPAAASLSPLHTLLRCLGCGGELRLAQLVEPGGYPELGPDGTLACERCTATYPIVGGTARMLPPALRRDLAHDYPRSHAVLGEADGAGAGDAAVADGEAAVKQQTADSFAYEWERFGDLREEWRKNFLDYMQPHPAESFDGRLLLDVGAGSGRHSRQAHELGADVVAVDLGRSIDVARRNLPPSALTVQADAEHLPFDRDTFDFVMSIGVLHHLPDTERAFAGIVPYARPGGWVHVYLYWVPEREAHRRVLDLVTAVRRVTVRMPHRLLHLLCYPVAAALFAGIVLPYRYLRRIPAARPVAEALPLKTYADYPFGVCLNDQFDRFSAPLERRFRADEVRALLEAAGLEDVTVLPNHGWVASGRRPAAPALEA